MLDRNEIAYKIKTTCTFYDQILDSNLKDEITKTLVSDYRDFVLDSIAHNRNINMVRNYDVILGEYVTNKEFQSEVQKRLEPYFNKDSEYECVIINLYDELDFSYKKYMQKDTSSQERTRWI